MADLNVNDIRAALLNSLNDLDRSTRRQVFLSNLSNQAYQSNAQRLNALNNRMAYLSDQYLDAGRRVNTVKSNFDELRASAKLLTDQQARSATMLEIDRLQAKVRMQALVDNLGDAYKRILDTSVRTTMNFSANLQQGSSAIQQNSTLMGGAFELLNAGANKGASALSALGTGLLASRNRFAQLGGVLANFGASLASIAPVVLQHGFNLLTQELEKTVTSFDSLSSSGALFANGLTGMRTASQATGLTLTQFANVMKASSEILSAAGGGVENGRKVMTAALTVGGEQMKTRLLNLGFSFEEQAVLVAETMRDMRQSGAALTTADAAQVAKQTEKYAENLRIISAITGEDARKKMDQARQAASQLAFQQKLATMDKTQRQEIQMAMANMSDIQQRNFMDMVNFGSVINREGAAAEALSSGLSDSVRSMKESFDQGNLTAERVRAINAETGERTKQEILENREIGLAGAANVGGLVQALSEILGRELQFRNKNTPEAIAEAERLAREQKTTTDEMTTNMRNASIAAQKMSVAMENLLGTLLPLYTKLMAASLGSLAGLLEGLVKYTGKTPELEEAIQELRIFQRQQQQTAQRSGQTMTPERQREFVKGMLEESRSAALNDEQKARLADIDRRLNAGGDPARLREELEKLLNEDKTVSNGVSLAHTGSEKDPLHVTVGGVRGPGMADGGIVEGPDAGYLAYLHGTEAVARLGPNKTIPVEFSGNAGVDAVGLSKLLEAMTAQTQKMEYMVAVNESMLRVLEDQRSISQDMLNSAFT